jgi:hypothetical protein
MSINTLLSKLKFLESQISNHLALIKESIEDVESLKKTIVGETIVGEGESLKKNIVGEEDLELPSDEGISQEFKHSSDEWEIRQALEEGAKWMREQIVKNPGFRGFATRQIDSLAKQVLKQENSKAQNAWDEFMQVYEGGEKGSATRQIFDSLLLTPKFYERFVQHFLVPEFEQYTEGGKAMANQSDSEFTYHRPHQPSEQKIYFICAQPNTIYYAWQLEVMLRNFNEMGILDNPKYEVHIVTNLVPRPNLNQVYQIGEVEVIAGISNSHTNLRTFYYNDTRATKHYPSSIRPNLLKQHFAKHPEIKTFFYHDCDMIFTKNDLDFTPFLQDDICYGSDVRFYIGHDYIASKEHNVLEYMCQIAQIPLRVVRDNEHNCIGAQYLIKNVSADFWEEVEKISEELFQKITIRNNYIKANYPKSYIIYNDSDENWDVWNAKEKKWEHNLTKEVAENRAKQLSNYHELQIFAADMWAVLWCLWKLGKKTVPHKFFDFAWATDTIERYNECNIYHNAGVTESGHGLFFKGEFQDKVPDKNLRINPHSACSPYYELVKQIMIVK